MVTTARPEPAGGSSLVALRWYLPLTFAANLACETAQLPLYTLWRESSAKEIAVIEAGLAPYLRWSDHPAPHARSRHRGFRKGEDHDTRHRRPSFRQSG
jgi:hypothetical protein